MSHDTAVRRRIGLVSLGSQRAGCRHLVRQKSSGRLRTPTKRIMALSLELFLAIAAAVAVTGTHAACDSSALMECVAPFSQLSGQPSGDDLKRLCSQFSGLMPCIERAQCSEQMETIQPTIDMLSGFCESTCAMTAMTACMQHMQAVDSAGSQQEKCSAIGKVESCVEGEGCTMEDMLASLPGASDEFKEVKDSCSGAGVITLSSLLLLVVSVFNLL